MTCLPCLASFGVETPAVAVVDEVPLCQVCREMPGVG